MPELPEVETVRRTLAVQLKDEIIDHVVVNYEKMLKPSKDDFINLLPNEQFTRFERYGKYLIFIFNHVAIISHLRMEGKYFIKHDEPILNHEHIIFYLKSGKTLRYHDVRKFGTMKILKTTSLDEILKEPEIKKLGLEANSPDLTGTYLYNKLNKLNMPIKTALLDQSVICGLGNIYVDEVLFLSKIHPLQIASTISLEDCSKIVKNSKETLAYAIECGGTTIRSYTSSLGVTGRFQLHLHVHTLAGKPCENCGTIIDKIRVGGRGTYFCYKCQRHNPFIIGITGGISSGKTAVTNYLMENYPDYLYLDADKITHELLETSDVKIEIENTFGDGFIVDDKVDRKSLGNLIFNSLKEREKLNKIIHPLVIKKIQSEIKKTKLKIVFVIIPLMFETGMDKLMDEIWYVNVPFVTQVERLMTRDKIDYEYALKKINSQMSIEEKQKIMSKKQNIVLIDNSKELCYTYNYINELMKERI